MSELELAYEATIEGWLRALEIRDAGTEGHCVRLADLCVAIGQELGIEENDLKHLRRGALLHDIGKIGIPDPILNKPGPLTDDERKFMELHTQFGRDIFAPIPFLQSEAEIVHSHHENWDGSGYPRGLKGTDIPLLARVVSVCNVWDALTSNQPYREAWSREDARNYIDLGSGYQFDPEIVDAFLHYIDQKR